MHDCQKSLTLMKNQVGEGGILIHPSKKGRCALHGENYRLAFQLKVYRQYYCLSFTTECSINGNHGVDDEGRGGGGMVMSMTMLFMEGE